MNNNNNQSAEDYLECILILRERQGNVRSIDVVNELGVTKPSVSVAMKKLREQEMITFDENGFILFTDAGRKLAKKVYDKHKILMKALIAIGVKEKIAAEEACQIEHVISDSTYKCIKEFIKRNGTIE
ncbi:MAG: metal-dependent transcriptional regulator [Lachnospiraceae bacterium]|nr:metal-dependent transcriptional regulator [Lachnospiraceae bacterium]MBQ3906902.1 metal-dependent transcriptional regulator [Lachnospiraceae bacterium]